MDQLRVFCSLILIYVFISFFFTHVCLEAEIYQTRNEKIFPLYVASRLKKMNRSNLVLILSIIFGIEVFVIGSAPHLTQVPDVLISLEGIFDIPGTIQPPHKNIGESSKKIENPSLAGQSPHSYNPLIYDDYELRL
ncbi:hypothetical protein BY996DRAFT_7334707 [Phakopsora pachyrhizi]|nr:hypothetical protein BY996DRAFT_7334707 [Phakopsora pachyrhizi]